LFDQLVQEFSDSYCIDLDHIYVVGHSLGARFTNSLACARGDVIRGIGSV
jgi:polyhydroxybutyrate depolymerase